MDGHAESDEAGAHGGQEGHQQVWWQAGAGRGHGRGRCLIRAAAGSSRWAEGVVATLHSFSMRYKLVHYSWASVGHGEVAFGSSQGAYGQHRAANPFGLGK